MEKVKRNNECNTRYKVCTRCDTRKKIKSFPKRKIRGKYYYKPYCCACQSARYRINHPEVRKKISQKGKEKYRLNQLLLKFKLMEAIGQTICSCGYSDIRALTFHHRDAKTKLFNISYGFTHSYSYETLLEEAKKCDILCHNCHAIIGCKLPILQLPQMDAHNKELQLL
jgi:hypothetical protein